MMKKWNLIILHCWAIVVALVMLGISVSTFLASPDMTVVLPLTFSAVLFWFFFRFEYPEIRHIRRVSRLSKCGVPARAKLISVELTGRYLNNQPQLAYTLEYSHPKTGQRFRGVTREYTTLLDLPAARNGDLLPILVDPKVPEEFIIDQQKINADMERIHRLRQLRRRLRPLP